MTACCPFLPTDGVGPKPYAVKVLTQQLKQVVPPEKCPDVRTEEGLLGYIEAPNKPKDDVQCGGAFLLMRKIDSNLSAFHSGVVSSSYCPSRVAMFVLRLNNHSVYSHVIQCSRNEYCI